MTNTPTIIKMYFKIDKKNHWNVKAEEHCF